jgi:hypothetical protein
MRISFERRIPGYSDPKLQKVVEVEQLALACGFLELLVRNLMRCEWRRIRNLLSNFERNNSWPKSESDDRFLTAADGLLNLIVLYHFQNQLIYQARGGDFEALDSIVATLQPTLLTELLEGLLSEFRERLDTITLTHHDLEEAFSKYGVRSPDGSSVMLAGSYMTKDAVERLQAQLPHYVNCIATDAELQAAKAKVSQYQSAEKSQRGVNYALRPCIMGYVKQMWQKGSWQTQVVEQVLPSIIAYQERNFPNFGKRPIGQLAIRVRDYISLQAKTPVVSTQRLKEIFRDLLKILEDETVAFLAENGALNEKGGLVDLDTKAMGDLLLGFRTLLPTSIVRHMSETLESLRDGLKRWTVFLPLWGAKAEQGDQLPALRQVRFLNKQEAQAFLDETVSSLPERETEPRLVFEFDLEAAALVDNVKAIDARRAAQIAHRIVRTVLDQFLFEYQHGSMRSNPKLNPTENVICIDKTSPEAPNPYWVQYSFFDRHKDDLLLRHPNKVKEQRKVIERLSKLSEKLDCQHPLAERVTKAIYWYHKGWWSELHEDRLLNYWISLETLIGPST